MKEEESIFHEIKTIEQGKKYILEIVAQVEKARAQCDDLSAPHRQGVPVELVRKAWTNLRVRYGQALGSLVTLMHCRVLNDVAYRELRQRVDNAMISKVIGLVEPW